MSFRTNWPQAHELIIIPIYTRKGWSFISAHPLLRCLEKPLKRMKRIRQTPSLCWYSKAQFGAVPKMIKHKGRAYHTSIHRFYFCLKFSRLRAWTDKAKYAYLDPLAILRFYTEPPIGDAKVVIKNGIRIAFWIFNTIFNLKYLVVSAICITRLVQKEKRTALSHPFILSIMREHRLSKQAR